MYEFIIGVLLINNEQRVCVLALVYFTASENARFRFGLRIDMEARGSGALKEFHS